MRFYHLGQIGRLDGPDGIAPAEAETPEPGPTGILIRIHTASINRRDVLILNGRYPLPAKPGVIPLSDGAGEVVAIGEAVTRFRVGDRVTGSYWPLWQDGALRPDKAAQLGCTTDGMLTQYAVLDEQSAVKVPDHLSWTEASALTCAGVTAWRSLTAGARLLPGQSVLVLGSGDVSLFAIQFGKQLGCRVIALTSDEWKAARLRELGADEVVNYQKTPDWPPVVRELTGGTGAELVLETQGPKTIERSVASVSFEGQIVLLRVAGDEPESLSIGDGVFAGKPTLRREFVGSRADLEAMNRAVALHRLRPAVDRVFGFDEVHAAYRHFMSRDGVGKVVVDCAA